MAMPCWFQDLAVTAFVQTERVKIASFNEQASADEVSQVAKVAVSPV